VPIPSSTPEPRLVNPTPNLIRASDEQQGATLSLEDIYYTLFRHKKKILVCILLGFVAAITYYKISPRVYQSEAKLFIRYVMESRTPGRSADDSSVKSPDPEGTTILTSELEIIKSLDLVGKVVDTIGVGKLMIPLNDGKDRDRAIVMVSRGFEAQVPARSSVIQLAYSGTDAMIVQPVLREFINCYLKKHVEIHRSTGLVDDFLTQETEQLRSRLSQTEEGLRKATNKLGFPSIEDAKKTLSALSSRLRQDIFEAETELAERSAFINTFETSTKSGTHEEPGQTVVPSDEVISAYGNALARIEFLRKAEQELLGQFTPENSRVKETHTQLIDAEGTKKKLEGDYPSLSVLHAPQPTTSGTPTSATDFVVETARVKALQAKIAALNEQLKKLRQETANVDQMEAEIVELNRKKELEETNYRKYAASLEQARLDEAMSSGHVSNISEIQSPSQPLKAKSKRLQIVLGLAFGGVAVGVAWAFIIDLFLDKTIKRPIEIERKLNLPLLLSIPAVNKAYIRRLDRNLRDENRGTTTSSRELTESSRLLAADDPAHALQPFHATLRDRLIQYFDDHNLVHKPKMIAVTGLNKNVGVTTTAAGLAQSLSETGEGNVLLVDMTAAQGSAQHYFKGKTVSSLEETLVRKDNALVQENLYVVSEASNSDRLARNLPQRFAKLVPKLKASDFDYIIFDMPPVSQISVTPRLANFMDMMLLVIESEKTDQDIARQASAMLAGTKTPVSVVLNKTKSYIPHLLHQDSEFLGT